MPKESGPITRSRWNVGGAEPSPQDDKNNFINLFEDTQDTNFGQKASFPKKDEISDYTILNSQLPNDQTARPTDINELQTNINSPDKKSAAKFPNTPQRQIIEQEYNLVDPTRESSDANLVVPGFNVSGLKMPKVTTNSDMGSDCAYFSDHGEDKEIED